MPDVAAETSNFVVLGAILFALGLIGVVSRRNMIVLFLCAELMLQGVSMTLVGFGAHHQSWSGQVMAILSLAIAAAEAAIAMALVVVLFRRSDSLDVSIWKDLHDADQGTPTETLPDSDFAGEAEPVFPHLTPAGVLPSSRRTTAVAGKSVITVAESKPRTTGSEKVTGA